MTPTSATGRSEPTGGARNRSGFTLVELLMTVAILGLAAGAVVLSVPDPRPSVAQDAERFAARLQRAREEAILSNRAVAVEVSTTGYGFSVFDGAVWSPLQEGPFRTEPRAEGVAVVLTDPPLRLAFDPTGAADPAEIALSRDGRRIGVSVDGAGEVTLHD